MYKSFIFSHEKNVHIFYVVGAVPVEYVVIFKKYIK